MNEEAKNKRCVISKRLIGYRIANRLTQSMLGKRVGVTAQAISKWERGKCLPDITLLPSIAALLNCSIDDLFE